MAAARAVAAVWLMMSAVAAQRAPGPHGRVPAHRRGTQDRSAAPAPPHLDEVDAACARLWRAKVATGARRRRARKIALEERVTRRLVARHPFDYFEPEWTCEAEERVGGRVRADLSPPFIPIGDGPKFVCGVRTLRPPCLVYSVGSNNDWTFEHAMRNLTQCEIHTFDPTLPLKNKTFTGGHVATFHPIGLAGFAPGERAPAKPGAPLMLSVEQMMRHLGHAGRRLDVFKVDCEGCEHRALPPLLRAIQRGDVEVGQIQVEIHRNQGQGRQLGTAAFTAMMAELLDAADKAGMRLFHKERNGWGCHNSECVEYAFVHERSAACASFQSTHCPQPAHAACDVTS